jgi:hypothetical protein
MTARLDLIIGGNWDFYASSYRSGTSARSYSSSNLQVMLLAFIPMGIRILFDPSMNFSVFGVFSLPLRRQAEG